MRIDSIVIPDTVEFRGTHGHGSGAEIGGVMEDPGPVGDLAVPPGNMTAVELMQALVPAQANAEVLLRVYDETGCHVYFLQKAWYDAEHGFMLLEGEY